MILTTVWTKPGAGNLRLSSTLVPARYFTKFPDLNTEFPKLFYEKIYKFLKKYLK